MTLPAKSALLLAAAAALHAQTAPDPAEILSQARLKISATMRQLPKYTCVQTIDRSYFTLATAPTSCEQAALDKKKGRNAPELKVIDRVRLDVAEGDGLEILYFERNARQYVVKEGYLMKWMTIAPQAPNNQP